MSLITRCPSCGTMFKVVPDQLKIAQGWVRCGHCTEVFDARQSMQMGEAGLLPLDRAADSLLAAMVPEQIAAISEAVEKGEAHESTTLPGPIGGACNNQAFPRAVPRWISDATQEPSELAPTDASQPVAIQAAIGVSEKAHTPSDEFDPAAWKAAQIKYHQVDLGDGLVSNGVANSPAGLSRPAALNSPSSAAPLADLTGSDLRLLVTPQLGGRVIHRDESEDESYVSYAFDNSSNLAGSESSVAILSSNSPATSSSELTFVRQGRRSDFWRQRRIRVGIAFLGLFLVATLFVQLALQYRDEIAARAPELKPVLTALCDVAGCVVGPLRRINLVTIDSSTFNKLGNDAFRLSFVLKNSATTALRVPSLEVTLTDLQNQVVTRRVVSPAEFGLTAATLDARAEMAGLLNIRVSSDVGKPVVGSPPSTGTQSGGPQLPVAGYRMLAFYP